MAKAPFVLLVNPWITDFAAYDLWAQPLGLLMLGALLRQGGCGVAYLDCLDRHDEFTNSHPDVIPAKAGRFGTGKYPKMPIAKPTAYIEVPRKYYRYGIHPESFVKRLQRLPKPDLIWVTAIMTYWYPGLQKTIRLLREIHPDVPVWLGGIYAKLCLEHARLTSNATEVIALPLGGIARKFEQLTGFSLSNIGNWDSLDAQPSPALDLIDHLTYAPVMASSGCPFSCPYCASGILQPLWQRRSASTIFEEILRWHRQYGVQDFAFYDDALLLGAEANLKPVLEQIITANLNLRFHTPNALHIRALSRDWCELLLASGFTTIRLGLETTRSQRHKDWGAKVDMDMFYDAIDNLIAAGFSAHQIGVYLLCGLPGQRPAEVSDAIELVGEVGVQPHLAEYSPVPGTAMWPLALEQSPYDLRGEPLYHNNSFFACRRPDFTWRDFMDLKEMARSVRRKIIQKGAS